jgi:hypothetical protein
MSIHRFRRRLWKHLRPEVKEWTLANWARFEREDLEWFDAARIAQVDDDKIPPGSLEGRKRAKVGGGRAWVRGCLVLSHCGSEKKRGGRAVRG